MIPITRTFRFLTAAFPHGAYQSQGFNRPELRGPSVKGELRWWFDALFADVRSECRLFGHVSSRQNSRLGLEGNLASRVAIRIRPLDGDVTPAKTEFMPHKGQDGGTKNAIPAGTRFELMLLPRREGVTPQECQRLERVLDAWLLMGAVGQRANRGAGSLWPDDAPEDIAEYEKRIRDLLQRTRLRAALLPPVFTDEHALRNLAGDFIHGPRVTVQRGGREDEVTDPAWPFGAARVRQPSALKLRAVELEGRLRLLAVCDGRHHGAEHLRRATQQLAESKEIGRLLQAILPQITACPPAGPASDAH